MNRRQAIQAGTAALAGLVVPRAAARAARDGSDARIPLVHLTDLYHPPQDPDDHIDLATVVALDAFDLRGVVLDVTERFLTAAPEGFDLPRDPGFVPVAQLGYLVGRAIPAAMGPTQPLRDPSDDASGRPRREQAGIELLLDVLRRSEAPVVLTVTGSARVVTAAFNRDPETMRAKTRAVVLNAGATGGVKREWNVGLDLAAYVGLWRSGLPLHWYPCATERSAFVADHERGTYWKASHEVLFHGLPDAMKGWFTHAITGNLRGDVVRALAEQGRGAVWEQVLAGHRNLWATASLVHTAGRVLARTPEGWRFVPAAEAEGRETWPFRLDPIAAEVDDEGHVRWEPVEEPARAYLFGRRPGADYAVAMAEALGALLASMPV